MATAEPHLTNRTRHTAKSHHLFFIAVAMILLCSPPVYAAVTLYSNGLFNTSTNLTSVYISGREYFYAFDNTTGGSWWQSNMLAPNISYIILRLNNQSAFNIENIFITWYDTSYDSGAGQIYGSNDDTPLNSPQGNNGSTNYTLITSYTSSAATVNISLNNTQAYKFYLINMTTVANPARPAIKEIQIYGDETIGPTPPAGTANLNISFVNRTPSDITTTALFTQSATFTYQYNTTGLSSVFLAHYVNSSFTTCINYVNGSCTKQNGTISYETASFTGGGGMENVTFALSENDILPSISNIYPATASSNVINLTGTNSYVADAYTNLTTTQEYAFYELQLNSTGTVSVYYYNSSYDFNSNPTLNSNVHLLANINGSHINHTHGTSNWDMLVPFIVNGSGYIGTVKATSTGGFLIRGNNQGILLYGYAGAVRENVTRTTANSGISWTASNTTLRTHLHQFSGTDKFCFAGQGNYTTGSNPQTNGTTCDNIDITLFPPEPPTVYTPNNTNYTRLINITYEASIPTVPASSIRYYNITLRNNDSTFNATIRGNNSLNTSFLWNTYGMNLSINTPYIVRVTAIDNNSLSSFAESTPFTLLTNGLFNLTARTRTNTTINNITTFTVSNSTAGYTITQNASQNGSALIDIIKGYNYLIQVDAAGYALQNYTLNASSNFTLSYSYLYREQTIDLRFYDEVTNAILNTTTVQLELISSSSSYNYTTTNGTIFADLLTPDAYTMRYGADNYSTRFYSLTIEEQSFNALNLTLCPDTVCSAVTLQVKDQFDNSLEGAIIKVLKFDIFTNSYVLQETLTTNFEGQVQSQLQLNNEYYKFIIEYDGEVVLSTLPTYIYGSTVSFVVTLGTSGFSQYFNATGIGGYITKINDAVYSFTWNDQDNTITNGCLYASTINRYGKTTYNSTCTATSSGTVFLSIDNSTLTTYLLEGIVSKGREYTIASLYVNFDTTLPQDDDTGMFILYLVITATALIGLWNPTIAVILTGITPIVFIMIGFITLSITTGIGIMVLSFIIAYILNK